MPDYLDKSTLPRFHMVYSDDNNRIYEIDYLFQELKFYIHYRIEIKALGTWIHIGDAYGGTYPFKIVKKHSRHWDEMPQKVRNIITMLVEF